MIVGVEVKAVLRIAYSKKLLTFCKHILHGTLKMLLNLIFDRAIIERKYFISRLKGGLSLLNKTFSDLSLKASFLGTF